MLRFIRQSIFVVAIVASTIGGTSCATKPTESGGTTDCGTLDGKQLYKDVEGCYYLNGSGGKEYVSSSNCRC
jgi:hypothetical protein